jgi:predicted alpha/beta-hydrolase family hydrolase
MINVAELNEIKIPVGDLYLKGNLYLPEMARSVIIFSHGSGSSRLSVRNQKVAGFLQALGLGTLLFDLLTELEDSNYQKRLISIF